MLDWQGLFSILVGIAMRLVSFSLLRILPLSKWHWLLLGAVIRR